MRFDIPLRFLKPVPDLMAFGQATGQQNGFGCDWTPQCLQEALFEILLFDPDTHIEALPEHQAQFADYLLPVNVTVHDELALKIRITESVGNWIAPGHQLTLHDAVTMALMAPDSPADYCIEITSLVMPKSAHEQLQAQSDVSTLHA